MNCLFKGLGQDQTGQTDPRTFKYCDSLWMCYLLNHFRINPSNLNLVLIIKRSQTNSKIGSFHLDHQGQIGLQNIFL